jgi:hypothetical protein
MGRRHGRYQRAGTGHRRADAVSAERLGREADSSRAVRVVAGERRGRRDHACGRNHRCRLSDSFISPRGNQTPFDSERLEKAGYSVEYLDPQGLAQEGAPKNGELFPGTSGYRVLVVDQRAISRDAAAAILKAARGRRPGGLRRGTARRGHDVRLRARRGPRRAAGRGRRSETGGRRRNRRHHRQQPGGRHAYRQRAALGHHPVSAPRREHRADRGPHDAAERGVCGRRRTCRPPVRWRRWTPGRSGAR